MMKLKYAMQIERHFGSIFKQPCVDAIQKISNDTAFAVALRYVTDSNGELRKFAFEKEWLCQDSESQWHVFSDEEYQSMEKTFQP